MIHRKYFPYFPFCTISDGSDHCEHYFQKLHQKYGTFPTKEICDESRIIAGEQVILNNTPGIKDSRYAHRQVHNFIMGSYPSFPLGSDLPAKQQVEKLYLKGPEFGNDLLKWLGMEELLVVKQHWDKPLFIKWKSATKNSSQTSQSKEGECDQPEEDEEGDENERIEEEDLKDDKEQIVNEEIAEDLINLLLMQKQLNNARTKRTIWIQRTVQLMKLRMLILMKNPLFLKQTTAWQQMTRYWLTIVQTVILHYKDHLYVHCQTSQEDSMMRFSVNGMPVVS